MSTIIPHPSSQHTTLFRKYLCPLYLYEWVSTFAFQDIAVSPFHNDIVLSPEHFHQPIIIQAHSRFQEHYVSTTIQNQCQGHMSFYPVFAQNNISVGYVITFASDTKGTFDVPYRLPFAPPYIARFVLDHGTQDLVLYMPSYEHRVISIVAFGGQQRSYNENQLIFVIPLEEYGWKSLPNCPGIVLKGKLMSTCMNDPEFSSEDEKQESSNQSLYTVSPLKYQQINKVGITEDDVKELFSVMSISNKSRVTLPSSNAVTSNISGHLATTTTLLSKYRANSVPIPPTTLINPDNRKNIQLTIIQILHRRKFSMGSRVDKTETSLPGYDLLTCLPNLHCVLQLSTSEISQAVSPKCMHVYYSMTLTAVTPDNLLIMPAETKQKKDREAVLEERKKRNRLSAARSNARKQIKVKQMQRDLEYLKVCKKSLEERERQCLVLNQQLIEQATTAGYYRRTRFASTS